MTDVKFIPDGYPRVSPYLHIGGAGAAIDFYKSVFGATERFRMGGPDGKIGHAELQIGDSVVMLADEYPEMGIVGPKTVGGTPVGVSVYVEDVDATVAKAVDAGAKVTRPAEDRFYGDRTASFEDPFGHSWSVQTHIEDVSPEEMQRRAAQEGVG
jgi:PhnB protein